MDATTAKCLSAREHLFLCEEISDSIDADMDRRSIRQVIRARQAGLLYGQKLTCHVGVEIGGRKEEERR